MASRRLISRTLAWLYSKMHEGLQLTAMHMSQTISSKPSRQASAPSARVCAGGSKILQLWNDESQQQAGASRRPAQRESAFMALSARIILPWRAWMTAGAYGKCPIIGAQVEVEEVEQQHDGHERRQGEGRHGADQDDGAAQLQDRPQEHAGEAHQEPVHVCRTERRVSEANAVVLPTSLTPITWANSYSEHQVHYIDMWHLHRPYSCDSMM